VLSYLYVFLSVFLVYEANQKAQKEDEDENEEEVAKMRKEMQELLSG